jgi:hypothetical protein
MKKVRLSTLRTGPPSLRTMGTRSFPRVKSGRGVTRTPHTLLMPLVMQEYSYTSTPLMGRTACTEAQCLWKGALYLYLAPWLRPWKKMKSLAIPGIQTPYRPGRSQVIIPTILPWLLNCVWNHWCMTQQMCWYILFETMWSVTYWIMQNENRLQLCLLLQPLPHLI